MINENNIIEYKNNVFKILLGFEGAKSHSIKKVLDKVEQQPIFYAGEKNAGFNKIPKVLESLLSDSIGFYNEALNKGASIVCQKDFNPLVNSRITVSFEESIIDDNLIAITNLNLMDYKDDLEKLIAINSFFNPFLQICGDGNTFSNNFKTKKISYLKQLIECNKYKGNLFYLISEMEDKSNLKLDMDDIFDGLKDKNNITININPIFYHKITESSEIFPKVISFLKNEGFLKLNIHQEIIEALVMNIDKIVLSSEASGGGMMKITQKLQNANMKNQDIEKLFLRKNLDDQFLISEYRNQFQLTDEYNNFIKQNFSDGWLKKFNDNIFERYVEIQEGVKFYEFFNKKMQNAIKLRYCDEYRLEDVINYRRVSPTHDSLVVSIIDLSKRMCSNVYEHKLNLSHEYYINNDKWKIKNNKKEIHLTYPKNTEQNYVDMVTYGFIDYLMELKNDMHAFNDSNTILAEKINQKLKQLIRVVELTQKTEKKEVIKIAKKKI